MAYTPCAASVAANIAIDCENPIENGYTGRAVLIPYEYAPTIVTDADNTRKVKSITLSSGQKFIAVNNVFTDPFTGSNKASNADSGRRKYGKTFAFRVPRRGADTAKEIIEPLANSALGFIAVVEKKDKTNDGSYEIIGLNSPLYVNADGLSQDESANGGDISVTMSSIESKWENTFVGTDSTYATAKTAFDEMYTTGAF